MSTSIPIDDIRTVENAKKQLIEASFGKEKAQKVHDLNTQLAKAVYDARKSQIEAQKPIFEQRKDLIKGIEKVGLFLVLRATRFSLPKFREPWSNRNLACMIAGWKVFTDYLHLLVSSGMRFSANQTSKIRVRPVLPASCA